MSDGRACIVGRVAAVAVFGCATLAAQQSQESMTGTPLAGVGIVGPAEVVVGEEWNATTEGCTGSVEWSAPGAEPPAGSGDSFTTAWAVHGAHEVSAACNDGEAGTMTVFVLDGTPFVVVGEVLNRPEARIGFEERLNVDAVFGDVPLGTIFRLVLYRRGSPIPSGGRSEVVSSASGVARVDAYCLSSGPIHEVELVLEDRSSGEEIAVSERLKIRGRKLHCE